MTNGTETPQGGAGNQEELLRQIREEIQAASSLADVLAKLEEYEGNQAAAEEAVSRRAEQAERDPTVMEKKIKGIGEEGSVERDIKSTELRLKETLRILEEHEEFRPPEGSVGREVIDAILENVRIPEITEKSVYLSKLVKNALSDPNTNPLELLTPTEFRHFKTASPIVAGKVIDSFRPLVTPEQIQVFEEIIKPPERQHKPNGESRSRRRPEVSDNVKLNAEELEQYDHDLRSIFKDYFTEEKDQRAFRALYSPEEFYEFVKKVKADIKAEVQSEGVALTTKELDIKVSETLEREIVLLYGKIFRTIDKARPDEFYQDLVQRGFMDSISVAETIFIKKLDSLGEKLASRGDLRELPDISGLGFYKKYGIREYGTRIEDGKEYNVFRTVPAYELRNLPIRAFLDGIAQKLHTEKSTREYLHNVRALYLKKPEADKGFWGQISQYSQQFMSGDIDDMMLLPDADIFLAANRLYQKYIEEDFATVSWIHQPIQFTADTEANLTLIEEKIVADLKRMFPDLAALNTEDWRLRRALSIGIGISRGVYLNEVETAALADPNLDPITGDPTYKSYYTNDNAALMGLNPQHHFLRWQSESVTRANLIYLLSEFDPKDHSIFGRIWDHTELWERAKSFRESFKKGVPVLDRKNPDERMFYESLLNIGRVGSVLTRGGWRTDAAEGWIVRDPLVGDIKDLNGNINLLETWKALENVGYEIVLDLTENKLFSTENVKNFLLSRDSQVEARKQEFFQYLYDKYLNRGGVQGKTLEQYLKSISGDAENVVKSYVKKGFIKRQDEKSKIEEEIYRRFINRTLVTLLRQRIPTKFIRIERDRLSEKGERAWLKLKNRLGWTNENMDEAMKNLGLVETKLRLETSDQMKKYLASLGEQRPDLSRFQLEQGKEYLLNEERIREIMISMSFDESTINSSLELFRQINKYLDEGNYLDKFAEKIRSKDAKGHKPPKDMPFSLGIEEVDTSFLAWRNIGPSPLTRALGDINAVETDTTLKIQGFLDTLEVVALDGKKDITPLIEFLKQSKYSLEKIHSPDDAVRLAYNLATMAIAYYRKDTMAKNIFTKLFRFGKKNSLAAEFTGAYRGVWEWEVAEIDKFTAECERWNIIPKEPYDRSKAKVEPRIHFTLPFTKKEIKLGKKLVQERPSLQFYGKRLRKGFAATQWHVAWELVNKWLPLMLIVMGVMALLRAFKEEGGQKK